MTIKELIADYKGELEIVVKQLSEDEAVEVVSFNTVEKDAIKDDILDAEISKWFVETQNRVPAVSKIIVLLKAVVTSAPSDPSASGGTTTPDDSSDSTP